MADREGHREGQGIFHSNIGVVYINLGRYEEALSRHEQALAIHREIGDRRGKGDNLTNIGVVHFSLGRYEEALSRYEQALAIHREIGDRQGEGDDLTNIGNVYRSLGRYQEALSHLEQALAIHREIGDRRGEGKDLTNIGNVYANLGRHQEALSHYSQSLAIGREIGIRRGEGHDLNNIGNVYQNLGRYQEALSHFEQALAVHREIGHRRGQGADIMNIGSVYQNLGRYQEALSHYGQALAIDREIGDRAAEATDLVNIGTLHVKQGHTTEALARYREALAIEAGVGNPETLWRLWSNLRQLWSAADRPSPAIVAGKRAVNTIQAMRAAGSGLDRTLQKSFLEDKESVYRGLADDLIGQGRIPEAEQVLAMLKEEELHDFIRRDSSDDQRTTRADLTPAERAWNDRYELISTDLARIGKDYAALSRIEDPTDEEETRLETLEAELDSARAALIEIVAALETEFAEQGGSAAVALGEQQLRWLEAQQKQLQGLGHGAALISTIVTKDWLHLTLTTPQVQLARQAPIGAAALNALIGDLRKALTDRHSDIAQDLLPLARRLHDHLLGPIAEDLKQTGSRTLMWSLDGALRYVPLAALHDGEQWLIERYPLVLYTAAARENLSADSDAQWRVAGLGVSKPHQGFTALDAVPAELDGIVKQHDQDPDGVIAGQVHLDDAFDARRLKRVIRQGFPVLHIASHFRLNPGDNSASYLLLGDGSALTLADFHTKRAFKLDAVDQLTLSACNTAMGNLDRAGSGAEVEIFGALAQKRGAKGVLATLWSVADASTGQLMQTLYRLRGADASLTKAEALRRAQLSLLQGSDPERPCGTAREPVGLSGGGSRADRSPADPACRYAHPHYWAPFILMGNWL